MVREISPGIGGGKEEEPERPFAPIIPVEVPERPFAPIIPVEVPEIVSPPTPAIIPIIPRGETLPPYTYRPTPTPPSLPRPRIEYSIPRGISRDEAIRRGLYVIPERPKGISRDEAIRRGFYEVPERPAPLPAGPLHGLITGEGVDLRVTGPQLFVLVDTPRGPQYRLNVDALRAAGVAGARALSQLVPEDVREFYRIGWGGKTVAEQLLQETGMAPQAAGEVPAPTFVPPAYGGGQPEFYGFGPTWPGTLSEEQIEGILQVKAYNTYRLLERGVRPNFIPFSSQQIWGFSDEEMEALGYIRGDNGWVKVGYDNPTPAEGGGEDIIYSPRIGGYYPYVSGNRSSSGSGYGLVNWRV